MKKVFLNLVMILLSSLFMYSCSESESLDESQSFKTIEHVNEFSVTSCEAQDKLEIILNNISETNACPWGINNIPNISSKYTTEPSYELEFDMPLHIFNFENNQGFAIMSSDSRTTQLFALVYSGSLLKGEPITNPELGIFVENLYTTIADELVKYDPTNDILLPYGDCQYGSWEYTPIINNEHPCKVNWGQGSPYNKYCNGNVTGCVATAVAQLMSCYEYPESYKQYLFNWNIMKNQSNTQRDDQIARLMQQLGLEENLHVGYGIEASAADSKHVKRTLDHFGYSQCGNIEGYNTDDIVTELVCDHPVLIRGNRHKSTVHIFGFEILNEWLVQYSSGHIWLGHGLMKAESYLYTITTNGIVTKTNSKRTKWYVLCNLGWSGYCNGYYLSSVFDTSEPYESDGNNFETYSNYFYRHNLELIKGIRP